MCLYSTAGWHVYCPLLVSLIVLLLLVSDGYVPKEKTDVHTETRRNQSITGDHRHHTASICFFVPGDYDLAHKSVSTRKNAKVIITKTNFNALADSCTSIAYYSTTCCWAEKPFGGSKSI